MYDEQINAEASGTSGKRIHIIGASEGNVIIKGSLSLPRAWERLEEKVWRTSFPIPSSVQRVFLANQTYENIFSFRKVLDKKDLQEETVYFDSVGDEILLCTSRDPNAYVTEVPVRHSLLDVKGNYISVKGLRFLFSSGYDASINLGGKGDVIESCEISYMNFKGIRLENSNNVLQSSFIRWCGNSGVGGRGGGHLIENNVVSHNNTDDYDNDWHSGGAKLIPGFCNSIVRNNVFSHNKGKGLWLDDNSNDNLIFKNVAFENEDAGIEVEISRGNLIVGNMSYGNKMMPEGRYRRPLNYSDYTKGFVATEKKASIHNGIGIFVSTAPETFVYNNTCYGNASSGIVVSGRPIQTSKGLLSTNDISLANNICVNNDLTQIAVGSDVTSRRLRGAVHSDYNVVHGGRLGVLFRNETSWEEYRSLTEWSNDMSNDNHSLHVTVRFVDKESNDFRLSRGNTFYEKGKLIKITRQYGNTKVKLELGPVFGYEGVSCSFEDARGRP